MLENEFINIQSKPALMIMNSKPYEAWREKVRQEAWAEEYSSGLRKGLHQELKGGRLEQRKRGGRGYKTGVKGKGIPGGSSLMDFEQDLEKGLNQKSDKP
jgi:hypothetical protein